MNIHEISLKSRIGVNALKRLEKLKVLKVDPEPDCSAALRFHMRGNARLSVPQLLMLIDDPTIIETLGRFADRARAQIAELGDFKRDAAPPAVTAYIIDAGRRNTDAARVLVNWAKGILPVGPVDYQWLAVRLLAGIGINLRGQSLKVVHLAVLYMRRDEEFSGYWHLTQQGAKSVSVYHSYAQLALDL